ncbi:MAG: hypothetical protein V5A27_04410 [Halapricum sp.]
MSDEYHRPTLLTRLNIRSGEDEQLLFDTIEEWLDGCNLSNFLGQWAPRTETETISHGLATM